MSEVNFEPDLDGLMPIVPFSNTSGSDFPEGGKVYQLSDYSAYRKGKAGNEDGIKDGEGHRRKILMEIEVALEHIHKAQEEDDPMIRATEAFYLEDCLKVLWDMRGPRENEFKELVNLLYLNLKYLTLENITNQQLEAYALILDQILRRTVRDEDFEKALDILEDNGIAPFAILASED